MYEPSSDLSQKRKSSRDLENERIRVLLERQKEQILAEVRSEIQKHELKADGQGVGVPKAGRQQAAADSRGSRTCVCANTFVRGVAHAREKDELTSCRGSRRGNTSGETTQRREWCVDDSPHLSLSNSQPCFGGNKGLRQGNRQGW